LAPKLQYQKIASVLRLEGTYTTKLTRIATVMMDSKHREIPW
jgi:hypothetical protein